MTIERPNARRARGVALGVVSAVTGLLWGLSGHAQDIPAFDPGSPLEQSIPAPLPVPMVPLPSPQPVTITPTGPGMATMTSPGELPTTITQPLPGVIQVQRPGQLPTTCRQVLNTTQCTP